MCGERYEDDEVVGSGLAAGDKRVGVGVRAGVGMGVLDDESVKGRVDCLTWAEEEGAGSDVPSEGQTEDTEDTGLDPSGDEEDPDAYAEAEDPEDPEVERLEEVASPVVNKPRPATCECHPAGVSPLAE